MVDKLKPFSKEWYARQRRHTHNSFSGHIGMLRANMRSIIQADTTTPLAKAYANQILHQADKLADALKVRIDAPPQA